MLQISRQSIKAHMSYSNFKKCCKKGEKGKEKYEENITNLEGAYLSAWWIQFKFGIGGAPPRKFT